MRNAVKILIALIITLPGLSIASTAFAHDSLVSSSPSEGETVSGQPTVELTFSDMVQENYTQIALVDSSGKEYQTGSPTQTGATVRQPISKVPPGDYTLSYRVVSSDGHPIDGSINFSVAHQPTSNTPPATATNTPPATATNTPPTPTAESGGSDTSFSAGPILTIVAVSGVLAIGITVFATRRKSTD